MHCTPKEKRNNFNYNFEELKNSQKKEMDLDDFWKKCDFKPQQKNKDKKTSFIDDPFNYFSKQVKNTQNLK